MAAQLFEHRVVALVVELRNDALQHRVLRGLGDAQMKQLIDSTASLWLKGEMEGKPAGVFTSTASTHGGQETTLLTMMVPLLHLGMLIVGVPYSVEGMLHTEGRGGTPYGASTVAGGQGELQPREEDLAIARALGRRVAEITARVRG